MFHFNFTASQVSDLRIYVSENLETLSLESSLFYHRTGSQTGDQPEQFVGSSPLTGRYVKVTRFQQEENFLCFTEIEVYQTEGIFWDCIWREGLY